MKVYISSRLSKKDEVKALYKDLRIRGHESIMDWTDKPSIRPYSQHAELACQCAIEDGCGAMNCDVFILLTDEAGTDMYTELGAALASKVLRGSPQIYIVGKHIDKSLFYYHPEVRIVENTQDVIREL